GDDGAAEVRRAVDAGSRGRRWALRAAFHKSWDRHDGLADGVSRGDAAGRGSRGTAGDTRRGAGRGGDRGQFASTSWNPRQPSWTDELTSGRRRGSVGI